MTPSQIHPNPIGVDARTGLELFNIGPCYVSAWTRSLVSSDPKRFADIAGPQMGRVMAWVGWVELHLPLCVVAVQPGAREAVAAGWAGPISLQDGRRGINLTYAVHYEWEGLGLATLAASLAFLQLEHDPPYVANSLGSVDFAVVNVQTRSANSRSTELARRLGMRRRRDRDFSVQMLAPGRPLVDYATFEMDTPPFLISAMALAEERLVQAKSECTRERAT